MALCKSKPMELVFPPEITRIRPSIHEQCTGKWYKLVNLCICLSQKRKLAALKFVYIS